MIDIQIATGGSAPIYRQIADQIRRAAAVGALQVGEQLPSVRALAERLVINPNTVARAYTELIGDGVLDGHQGKGVFVAPRRAVFTKAEKMRRIDPALEAFVNAAIAVGLSPDEIRQALDRKLTEVQGGKVGKWEGGKA